MSTQVRSRVSGVIQSLSDSGTDEGTISRADYDAFVASSGGGGATFEAKSGTVPAVNFAGTPKKVAVAFATAYLDASYSIGIEGADSRAWSFESKSAMGFTINSNADTALTGEVLWFTTPLGESP